MTAVVDTATAYNTGRELSAIDTIEAVGRITFLGVSGGRWGYVGPSTISLPVSNGYRVTITIGADDLFIVRREFVRGGTVFDHGELRGVFVDTLSDVVWSAHAFRSDEFGEAA
jgi:hypothetical protein